MAGCDRRTLLAGDAARIVRPVVHHVGADALRQAMAIWQIDKTNDRFN
jgi:hypothetical protein